MKYYIHTTGCKANQWDSHVVSDVMKGAGLLGGTLEDADVIVINACTLTDGAERDIRRFINLSRRKNEKAAVILTGCHGQVYPDRAYGADLVLGQKEKYRILEYLGTKGTFVSDRDDCALETFQVSGLPRNKTRFFLKIQDGCDRYCTYCIVPYARGNPRSRPADEVMAIMGSLRDKGVKEVVLTGIEISAYRDPGRGIDFKTLLKMMEDGDTPPRIRMSSVDPLYIDDEFIEVMAQSRKIMKSIHIPLQSGSDSILRTMGRRYTKDYIADRVEALTSRIPSIGIGLDVITGFPGEDEGLFGETLDSIERMPVYYLHVFPFSARKGTEAARMANAVSEKEKKERVQRLRALDTAKRTAFYERFMGDEVRIIPEGKTYRGEYMRGYTNNYIPLYLPYEKGLENRLLTARIEEMRDGLLLGRAL